jgi:hypothetical protein
MTALVLKAGNSYTNIAGALVELIASSNHEGLFVDTNGIRYDALGKSLSSDFKLDLRDPALKVAVGETYEFHWKDGCSVGRYVVTAVDDRGYDIVWSNSATLRINYGCPLNYESKRIAFGPGSNQEKGLKFKSGWSMNREYGLVRLPGSEDPIISGGIFGMGKWVLRDTKGDAVAMDKYRDDLIERYPECDSVEEPA